VYHLHGATHVVESNAAQALKSAALELIYEAEQKSLLAGASSLPVDHTQVQDA